jgi:hypothetical protein
MPSANLKTQRIFIKLVESGRIKVFKNGTVFNTKTGKIYNRVNSNGYISIAYKHKGRKIEILLHRLLWLVWKGWLKSWEQINHLDGVKTNNRISNLEKTDNQGNCQHAWDTGLRVVTKRTKELLSNIHRGENSACAKLTNKQANKVRELYNTGNYTQRRLAKLFDVHRSSIVRILANRSYKAM